MCRFLSSSLFSSPFSLSPTALRLQFRLRLRLQFRLLLQFRFRLQLRFRLRLPDSEFAAFTAGGDDLC
jgi:hypothetical protein